MCESASPLSASVNRQDAPTQPAGVQASLLCFHLSLCIFDLHLGEKTTAFPSAPPHLNPPPRTSTRITPLNPHHLNPHPPPQPAPTHLNPHPPTPTHHTTPTPPTITRTTPPRH